MGGVSLAELMAHLNELLQPEQLNDYCPNGLQVEGRSSIKHLVSGVTASQALLDEALQRQADAVLVHHGYFWQREVPVIVGMKRQRIKTLLANDINLIVYHLPLDVHPTLGNNAQLAAVLGIQIHARHAYANIADLLYQGSLEQPQSAEQFAAHVRKSLARAPLHIAPLSNKPIQSIAWCTGGAQQALEQAIALGVDAYLTGEASESSCHLARENDIHFFAAGHHATERYGVAALGDHLAQQFAITHDFVDINNPI